VAASNVVLTEDLRRSRERIVTAREEERRRLRRDLHDGLGPQLTGVALGLDVASDSIAATAPGLAADVDKLREELQDAIQDVRRLVNGLGPARLDDMGLQGTLKEMAARVSRGGLAVKVEAAKSLPSLPAAVEVAAFRIAAEAITNVVRHAHATTCEVSLSVAGEALRLTVLDDGCGRNGTSVEGVGTASMRERAEEVGGTFRVEDRNPSGLRVEVSLPLDVRT
jgi:signal transduction histidine kinase